MGCSTSIAERMPVLMRVGAFVAREVEVGSTRWWYDFRRSHAGHRMRPRTYRMLPDRMTGRLWWRRRHLMRFVVLETQRRPDPGDVLVYRGMNGGTVFGIVYECTNAWGQVFNVTLEKVR